MANILQDVRLLLSTGLEVYIMNVSATQNSPLKALYIAQSNIATQAKLESTPIPNSTDDKVTLSVEGRQAAASVVKSGVEQYAMPSWFSDFSPAFSNLGAGEQVEEGRKFSEMSEKLRADGEMSQKDQNAIQSYLNNMSATVERKQTEAHYMQNTALFEEYGTIHNNHFNEALAEQGITTQEDWNEKVLNVEGNNQALRFSIMEKMFNDPRAMELMNTLGIKRPNV